MRHRARVAIVGAGPAGLQAAIAAARAGHRVTVFEKDEHAGGQVRLAASVPNRAEFGDIVLDQLAEANGELAEEVRLLLFTFEDIVKLDDRSIQMVLKDVDQKDLAIALRGVSDEVRSRVFANMSERGAEMLREEIEFQPPQRRRVVEEAQGRIVSIIRRLEEAGDIVLGRAAGEDEVV